MRLTPILCCAQLLATASCSTRSPEAVTDPLERDFGRLPLVQAYAGKWTWVKEFR